MDLNDLQGDRLSSDDPEAIRELIIRRRRQMLVHSFIYYHLDDNIWSDHMWQAKAFELAALQNKYPQHCKQGFYDEAFRDWTGATGGSFLPLLDPWVQRVARRLLWLRDQISKNPHFLKGTS